MKPEFMVRALQLAEKARGRTSPNPMVGAVIVKGNKIIAEGHHEKAGGDHAEVAAIKKAKGAAKDSCLYVTLEPCCHHGRTPPCTDAIIKAGIKKVVVAMQDPNPLVSGQGMTRLKKAGITVLHGLLQNEAKKLNEAYYKFITQKTPFVTLKAAISLDGKIADSEGVSKWISNETSRQKAHEMRNINDAVMVGVNTVLKDDPRLNVRLDKKGVKQPLRVIVDSSLQTPPGARVLHSHGGEVLIATASGDEKKARELENEGATIIYVREKNKKVDLAELMRELGKRDVVSVLLEGGAAIFADALKEGVVDKVALFYAPIILGGASRYSITGDGSGSSLAKAMMLESVSFTAVVQEGGKARSENFLVEGYIRR